jgi:hypothetical protein
MKVVRPRFTVRRLMVAVVVVGLIAWAGMMKLRRDRYLARAAYYGRFEAKYQARISDSSPKPSSPSNQERLALFIRMRAKYERAACYPWLPVEPDTPEPE